MFVEKLNEVSIGLYREWIEIQRQVEFLKGDPMPNKKFLSKIINLETKIGLIIEIAGFEHSNDWLKAEGKICE